MEHPTAIAAEAETDPAPVGSDEFFLAERDGLFGALWLVPGTGTRLRRSPKMRS
jgi:hypothetical protein